MLTIRKAVPDDTAALYDLYSNHLTASHPRDPLNLEVWRERIARFGNDPYYH